MSLHVGQSIEVPGLAGRWQVWSKSDACPGAYFVVSNGKYHTVKATQPKGAAFPKIELLD